MSKVEHAAWDFSPVFNLIHNLSRGEKPTSEYERSVSLFAPKNHAANGIGNGHHDTAEEEGDASLGDFTSLWDHLGVQRDIPPPKVSTFEAYTASQSQVTDAYTSDGALYYPPSSKSVQWKDDVDPGIDPAQTQTEASPPSTPNTLLSKSQRKKQRHRERKEEQAQMDLARKLLRKKVSVKQNSVSESEKASKPPTGQAGANPEPKLEPISRENVLEDGQSRLRSGKVFSVDGALLPSQVPPIVKNKKDKKASKEQNGDSQIQIVPTTPQPPPTPSTLVKTRNHISHANFTNSYKNGLMNPFIHSPSKTSNQQSQSTLTTPHRPTQNGSLNNFPTILAVTPQTQPIPRFRHAIEPLPTTYPDQRNWDLLLKILHRFPDDRRSLLSPLQLSINRPVTHGIHVFVDSSNILIGFHQHLKRARGIPLTACVPLVYPSFHALALLLERRRPVAKRVLVGSSPEVAAYEEARQVGYETCILDKVWKARELTEKQRRFAAKAAGGSSGSIGKGGYTSEGESGGESGGAQQQRPRWVEQAVDEIIHMKMLESLVDTPVPVSAPSASASASAGASLSGVGNGVVALPPQSTPPTMVLATGDAAEAEYSSGFMKVVQRALERGWCVEVASWADNTSMEYRRMEKRPEYMGRFRVIELDHYAEELFSESGS